MSQESPWLYASEYYGPRVAEIEAFLAEVRDMSGITTSDELLRFQAEHGTQFAPYLDGLAQDAAAAKFAAIAGNVGTFVEHAADADYARPLVPGPVVWSGTVFPSNAISGDYVFLRQNVPVEPDLPWLGKFIPSSIALADGSPISAWTNGGSGPNLAQADSSRRPVKTTIGGKEALTFDGADDRLELTWAGSLAPATYIIVYRPTTVPTGASTDYILDTFNATSINRHRAWLVGTDGVHVGSTAGGSPLTAPMPAVDQWHILSFAANGGASICRHDAVDFSFNPGGAGSDSMSIGGPATASGNQGLIGAIGDVRVMGSAVSLGNIQSVEAALAYQYGITLP